MAFSRATAIDSLFALAWYRLSIANEWLTRSELARQTAAHAARLADRLPEHDQLLLQGLLATRLGRPTEAERVYRSVTGTYPDDLEGWSQLGEVLFHHGPLQGHPAGESRGAWIRVLQIDPDNVAALLHLARVASSEAQSSELDSIVRRVVKLAGRGGGQSANAGRAEDLEALALQAFSEEDSASQRQALAALRGASDATLVIAAHDVTLYSRNLHGGAAVTRLLTEASRAPYVRAVGHIELAYLAAAAGQLRAAEAELAAARRLDPQTAGEYTALLAALPFLPPDKARLERARQTLVAKGRSGPVPASASNYFAVHGTLHEDVYPYLMGLLAAGMGDEAGAIRRIAQLAAGDRSDEGGGLRSDLAKGVRAEIAWQRNRPREALQALEGVRMEVWYQFMTTSAFYSEARERYLRGQALEALGRFEDALPWYSSFAENSVYDLAYVAPGEMRQAEIDEKLGRQAEAVRHYRRFVELWQDADPEFQPMLQRARDRLTALATK
jgi:tetratricopeptide (TPR) repeat protein